MGKTDTPPGQAAPDRTGASLRALWPDILAGLTLWGVLVPEGLAYAGLAGLPLTAGLYTLVASLPVYFLLGGSPVLVCAATSAESIMLAAVIAPLAGGDPARYAALTALLVLLVGLLFLAAGLLRLGRMTSFLSKPVMTGFVCGLAVSIAAGQFPKLLGLPRGHGDTIAQVAHLAAHLGQCNRAALAVGLAGLALLFAFARIAPRLPAGLCVMALGIAASRFFELRARHGAATVEAVAAGLPSLALPALAPADMAALAPAAAGLALVAFSQALGAAESVARRLGSHVDADRELRALGAANLGSSMLGGLLAGGSLSSTAVNVAAGARSRFAGLTTAVMVVPTLCYLTPVFRGLPEAVLGAVVVHAVAKLMKFGELGRYFRVNRNEWYLALVALLGVVVLGILPGLVLAVSASLLRLVVYASGIELSVLGRLSGGGPDWVATARHPGAEEVPGVRVLRLEGELFFANAERFRAAVLEGCARPPRARALAIQLRANRKLCITSTDMLRDLAGALRQAGVLLAFIDPAPGTLAMLRAGGVTAIIGEERIYPDAAQAVAALSAACAGEAA